MRFPLGIITLGCALTFDAVSLLAFLMGTRFGLPWLAAFMGLHGLAFGLLLPEYALWRSGEYGNPLTHFLDRRRM